MASTTDTAYEFDLYIEPDLTVRTLDGRPIAGATVTLYAYDAQTGSFLPVPNGDAIMAPVNRSNPDTTDEFGNFGWDLSGGIYKIRAAKAGCAAPSIPWQSFVESDVLAVPNHNATDLDLYLDCSKNYVYIYLPLVQR